MFADMEIELIAGQESLGCSGLGSICGEQDSELGIRGWAGCAWVGVGASGAGGSQSQGAQAVLGVRREAPSFKKRGLLIPALLLTTEAASTSAHCPCLACTLPDRLDVFHNEHSQKTVKIKFTKKKIEAASEPRWRVVITPRTGGE